MAHHHSLRTAGKVLRVTGDVALVVETDGLHFVPHNNATWKTKVQLMDASTVKDEAAFVLREGR